MKKMLLFAFVLLAATCYSQRKNTSLSGGDRLPMALGFYYEKNTDITKRGYQYDNGVMADPYTKRERLGIDLLYGLYKRLQMESGLGVSFYNSEVVMGALAKPNKTSVLISQMNFILSQKALYNVYYVSCFEWLKLTFSPYFELEYEQFLKRNRKREQGYDNLFSEDANWWIAELGIPAVSGTTKAPVGILSAVGGLSLEALLFKKIGVTGEVGYAHSLFGSSQIDVKWRYQDEIINADSFKSEKSKFVRRLKLRFYF